MCIRDSAYPHSEPPKYDKLNPAFTAKTNYDHNQDEFYNGLNDENNSTLLESPNFTFDHLSPASYPMDFSMDENVHEDIIPADINSKVNNNISEQNNSIPERIDLSLIHI